jgi:hypothetical protein
VALAATTSFEVSASVKNGGKRATSKAKRTSKKATTTRATTTKQTTTKPTTTKPPVTGTTNATTPATSSTVGVSVVPTVLETRVGRFDGAKDPMAARLMEQTSTAVDSWTGFFVSTAIIYNDVGRPRPDNLTSIVNSCFPTALASSGASTDPPTVDLHIQAAQRAGYKAIFGRDNTIAGYTAVNVSVRGLQPTYRANGRMVIGQWPERDVTVDRSRASLTLAQLLGYQALCTDQGLPVVIDDPTAVELANMRQAMEYYNRIAAETVASGALKATFGLGSMGKGRPMAYITITCENADPNASFSNSEPNSVDRWTIEAFARAGIVIDHSNGVPLDVAPGFGFRRIQRSRSGFTGLFTAMPFNANDSNDAFEKFQRFVEVNEVTKICLRP